MAELPSAVRIVEVGPRDGLQNEPDTVPTDKKVEFIRLLAASGLKEIEVASFVHPKWMPQLADAQELIRQLVPNSNARYSALVPNMKGLERALETGIRRIAVFTAASETFNRKNINMGIQESIDVFKPVVDKAIKEGLSVRGYVSTCFVCPYEGPIAKEKVAEVARALFDLGVYEVSIGDTIGAATPKDVEITGTLLLSQFAAQKLAMHFHDTYGMAIANVYQSLQMGFTTFDSSAGGIGGCPYAPGASGNVATEDLLYLLDRLGIETGVSLKLLRRASHFISSQLARELPSRVLKTS
ncbi:MAG: hydroxymethylglutaryl-CoA lyase [Acidobacteria bacterium]|nr:hydroxymethylglutaryl-CoA lyase [Acidobacteriota bacterium]